jgi:hypothetical protein
MASKGIDSLSRSRQVEWERKRDELLSHQSFPDTLTAMDPNRSLEQRDSDLSV